MSRFSIVDLIHVNNKGNGTPVDRSYSWQYKYYRKLLKGDRVILNTSRTFGKSFVREFYRRCVFEEGVRTHRRILEMIYNNYATGAYF